MQYEAREKTLQNMIKDLKLNNVKATAGEAGT